MSNSEKVSGPGNGVVPALTVILLTAGLWLGLWTAHKRWYQYPINPIDPAQAHPGSN